MRQKTRSRKRYEAIQGACSGAVERLFEESEEEPTQEEIDEACNREIDRLEAAEERYCEQKFMESRGE